MGTYLEFKAKPGCEDQINAAYAAMTGDPDDWLVYSDRGIKSEIAFIHSPAGEAQAHMRSWLNTVDDWNNAFTVWRSGTGQIKLSGVDDEDKERVTGIERDIQFILDNRMLFEAVTGLDDARKYGFCDFLGDLIDNHQTKARPPSDDPKFSDLPRATSSFYRSCVKHNRPDLWGAYVQFRDNPCEKTWVELRNKTVPWLKLNTVWSTVEKRAAKIDGRDFGLRGRFRDGHMPSLMLVRTAIQGKTHG